MIPLDERARIILVAEKHGIDARLLAALRQTEAGRAGREFGVLIPGETTWEAQANDAARTIRHVIGRMWKSLDADAWNESTARYSDLFVRYFSSGGPGYTGYAPVTVPPVDNDPNNLNSNHYKNLSTYYRQECATS